MGVLTTGAGKHPATGGGGGGDSAEYTAFIARTSGLDGTHTSAFQTFINGVVADGDWGLFDGIIIPCTQDSTTALLSLVSAAYNGTATGSPNFSADNGFLGVDASGAVYINTGFNPALSSSPKFVQDSAHVGFWSLTNAASGATGGIVAGLLQNGHTTRLFPKYNDGNFYADINSASGGMSVANSDSTGHYIVNRSASNAVQSYRNGSSIVTAVTASSGVANQTLTFLANNNNGVFGFGGGYRGAAFHWGQSLSSTVVTRFNARLATYMATFGH